MLGNHQKTILLNIVANPFFLALPITIAVIFFLPNPSSKYKVELSEKVRTDKPICQESFHDLNNDSVDERVVVFHSIVKGETSIKVLTSEGTNYDQWNFHGHFQKGFDQYYCADLNNDGFSEIYVFYFKDDSIFMGAVQPYPDKKMLFRKKFVSTVERRDGNIDYIISTFKVTDIDNDGFNELLFHIKSGFSRQPRSIFIYDHQDCSFKASKSIGAYYGYTVVSDLDNDSIPEIYCGSYTVANIHDSLNIPYNDYSSWLLGYNSNLEFLFPPIEQKAFPSNVKICNYTNIEGKKFIAATFTDLENNNCKLVFYEAAAKEYSSIDFEFTHKERKNNSLFLKSFEVDKKPFLLIGIIDGYFVMYNENLEVKRIKTDIGNAVYYFSGDFNSDGIEEFIFKSITCEHLIILDHKLQNPVWVKTNMQIHSQKPVKWGIKHNKTKADELFIKAEDNIYLFVYSLDYLYYLKYLIWFLVYGLVALILWFTQRIQNIRAKRRLKIEETINSLQMKTIKSQMDPHFMFNVLNGLANNVAKGNTTEAHDQILRFSVLLRSMMKRTDRIDISLSEEIEFITSYLELEKFRFKNDFNFNIDIGDGIDQKIRIPRMLIQLLVENSIKHGLRNKEGVKKLDVNIHCKEEKTQIIVEDNGVGRKQAMKTTHDTGKGMKLIRDMIKLNRKLGGKEISIRYTDLYDGDGKAIGTRVEVDI